MANMIDDMLDLARARLAGGIPLQRDSIDLGALLQRTLDECRSAHPGCRLEYSHSGDARASRPHRRGIGGRPVDAVPCGHPAPGRRLYPIMIAGNANLPHRHFPCMDAI